MPLLDVTSREVSELDSRIPCCQRDHQDSSWQCPVGDIAPERSLRIKRSDRWLFPSIVDPHSSIFWSTRELQNIWRPLLSFAKLGLIANITWIQSDAKNGPLGSAGWYFLWYSGRWLIMAGVPGTTWSKKTCIKVMYIRELYFWLNAGHLQDSESWVVYSRWMWCPCKENGTRHLWHGLEPSYQILDHTLVWVSWGFLDLHWRVGRLQLPNEWSTDRSRSVRNPTGNW